jgi:serine/threonine protein kinase
MIGKMIGNLKILSELGRGGMGIVYLAEHIELGKRFFVKHLLPEFTQDARFTERFRQKTRHQALLTHPNIVQVTDFIEQGGQYFLVMEYVDGLPLDELIARRGRLGEHEALSILRGVLEGLDVAARNWMKRLSVSFRRERPRPRSTDIASSPQDVVSLANRITCYRCGSCLTSSYELGTV